MIYYDENGIVIRDLRQSDAQIITDEEIAQGWQATVDKYEMRLRHRAEGKVIALAAERNGSVAGYVNVYPDSEWGAYANRGYAEIVDLGVLEKYRHMGIGGRLMDVAERVAFSYSDVVYLGVGLHSGYGSAQRMYVRRGYVPDGSGVWYGDRVCEPYSDCRNDDELVLYLSKHRGAEKGMPVLDVVKPEFAVIGREGSTDDGEGFIQKLWNRANSGFPEIEALCKRRGDGSFAGFWGAMTDFTRSFKHWEDFSRGLYLAGAECEIEAEAPSGWTKWIVPSFEYLRFDCGEFSFSQAIDYVKENGFPVAGAVHDFTDPRTGRNYIYVPIGRADR